MMTEMKAAEITVMSVLEILPAEVLDNFCLLLSDDLVVRGYEGFSIRSLCDESPYSLDEARELVQHEIHARSGFFSMRDLADTVLSHIAEAADMSRPGPSLGEILENL
jgi:hypothetical protein